MSNRSGIAVVTSGFPRLSETFALHELAALEARGVLAGIFATRRREAALAHPMAARLLPRVTFLPECGPDAQAAWLAEHLADRLPRAVHGYFAHVPARVAQGSAGRLGIPFGFSVHARDARKLPRETLANRAAAARCVVACNDDVARELAAAGRPPILLPHGVDLARFVPRPAPQDAGLRLLAVGRLVPKKGFEVLIEALAKLPDEVTLRVVGDGPLRGALEGHARALGLGARVQFCGVRTHETLPDEYAGAHAVVVPSRIDASGDRDGLPNVVLEAMASARAVVASDVGAVASAIDGVRAGILVPPGDPAALARALSVLARDPARRDQLGAAARARVERDFDLARCAARFVHTVEAAYA